MGILFKKKGGKCLKIFQYCKCIFNVVFMFVLINVVAADKPPVVIGLQAPITGHMQLKVKWLNNVLKP